MPTLRLFDASAEPLQAHDAPLTCAEVCTLYMRHADAVGLHCATSKAERQRILPKFMDVIGTLLVTDAKPYHLSEWIEGNARWKSVSTRRSKANQVRAAFQWAFDSERIVRNPFRSVRYGEAEPREAMDDATLNLFTFHANKRFEAVLRFLRFTGCRLGELCEAKWQDVDLERGEWTIPKHKSRRYTKRSKRVALVNQAVALLRVVAQTNAIGVHAARVVATPATPRNITDPVFINNHGRPWTPGTLGIAFRWVKKRHKIETTASLHGIRHQLASSTLGAGAAVKLIAEQLGHSRTDVLNDVYYHRSDSHLAAMRAAVEMGLPREPE